MYAIHYFWLMQPMEIKLTVLGLLMIVLVSAVRFVGLAWRIYHEPRGVIGPEDVSRGAVDPDLLARSALANRVPWQGILAKLADTRPSAESAGGDQSAPVYRMAESAFLCLWKKCQADVEAGKRACVAVFLATCIVMSWGAYSTFENYRGGNRWAGECLYLTLFLELRVLALGLSLCAVLYLVSSALERKLAHRRISWEYFCARWKDKARDV
jgi:hypothetical protein